MVSRDLRDTSARTATVNAGHIAIAECEKIGRGGEPDGLARLVRVIHLGEVYAVRPVIEAAR